MKKNIMTIVLLFLLVSTSLGYKEKYGTKITATYVNSNNLILIKCDAHNGWLTIGNADNENAKVMFANALMAYHTQKACWIRWADTGSVPKVSIISQSW